MHRSTYSNIRSAKNGTRNLRLESVETIWNENVGGKCLLIHLLSTSSLKNKSQKKAIYMMFFMHAVKKKKKKFFKET